MHLNKAFVEHTTELFLWHVWEAAVFHLYASCCSTGIMLYSSPSQLQIKMLHENALFCAYPFPSFILHFAYFICPACLLIFLIQSVLLFTFYHSSRLLLWFLMAILHA